MATAKKATTDAKTPAQLRKENESLKIEIEKLKNSSRCLCCDTIKSKDDFYVSTDPMNKTGHTPICKLCAKKIALRVDRNGEEHEPTIDSVCDALKMLNKPFINSLWDSSVQESENLVAGKIKHNPWTAYTKNVAMKNYIGMTWDDSDMFKEKIIYEDEKTPQMIIEEHISKDTYDDYIRNKKDVKRLLGYDPFEQEAISDQPLLYAQLLGLLDSGGDGNDDMIRNASAITIVRGFLQQSKLDNAIAGLMTDFKNMEKNSATIKSYQESKSKITGVIKDLAAESCISLKNNKNAKKGENTWTGKIKKLKDLNLREAEVNGFDIGTCRGMQQVLEMSDASIMKQLALDESEWSDMVAEQREMLITVQNERDIYKEINRILLRENLDLRDTLEENELLDVKRLQNLKSLFSAFGDIETQSEDGDEDE